MKKHLLTLAAAALTATAAMAEATELYTAQFGVADNQQACNLYTNAWVYTNGDLKWNIQNFSNNNNGWSNIRCGRKAATSVATITTDFEPAEKITKVVLTIDALTAGANTDVNSISLQTSSDNTTWTTVASVEGKNLTATSKTGEELTFAVENPQTNLFYRLSFDCAADSKAKQNGFVHVSKIAYWGESALTGNQKPADISFPESSYIVTESVLAMPKLNNPNNLEVTYTSSNPDLLQILDGGEGSTGYSLKFSGFGTATVTATTPESDDFAAGKAVFSITRLEAANSVAKMIEMAPNKEDKVYVDCALTVVYVNGFYTYVKDIYDNATLLYQLPTIYKVGDVIPAGWEATNSIFSGLIEWKGNPAAATSTEAVRIPTVEKVSLDNVNEIVTLANVTLSTAMSEAVSGNVKATMSDGTEIIVRNNFKIEDADIEAGTYNIKGAVAVYTKDNVTTLQFYPIEFAAVEAEPVFPTEFVVKAGNEFTSITKNELKYEAGMGYTLYIEFKSTEDNNSLITIELPEGWDTLYTLFQDAEVTHPAPEVANAAEWQDPSVLYGFSTDRNFQVVADKYHYEGFGYLGANGKVDMSNQISINFYGVKDSSSAVDEIETADANAEYFTLQGVKVINPEAGVYVRVANGKASKIVIK